jgi:hypothetical protein
LRTRDRLRLLSACGIRSFRGARGARIYDAARGAGRPIAAAPPAAAGALGADAPPARAAGADAREGGAARRRGGARRFE